MKIILDTNVFISGIFFTGPPSQILNAWKNSRLQIVLSQEILNEYQSVAEDLFLSSKRSIYCPLLNWLQFMANSLILKISIFSYVKTLMKW